MEQDNRIRVAITQGDTNGVGLEVILKAFADPTIFELCTPILYGNPHVVVYHRKACDLTTNFTAIQHIDDVRPDRLNLLVCDDTEVPVNLGQESVEAGSQALKALERAVRDYKEGKVDVLVTAPINKHTIQGEGFHFPGHTEYIEASVGEGEKALMILMNERVRVALVTTHLPIAQVAQAITQDNILQRLRIFDHSLRRDFAIEVPRIAVLALNPHAGDDGLLGKEEQDILIPAIEQANKDGIHAYGPYAADGFFGARNFEHFDGVLAMYHDQGLAPFKTLAMDDGVNYTAGLSLVRTSPDHGTAYDIAGKGEADENSFRQALYAAIDIFRNRHFCDEGTQNPLPKLYRERREDERRPRKPIEKSGQTEKGGAPEATAPQSDEA